jgi:D-3-phosphoglycerate dehydrogenase
MGDRVWNVLVTSRFFGTAAPEALEALPEDSFCLRRSIRKGGPLAADELAALVTDVDAIVCGDDQISTIVLGNAPRLKLVVKHGVGVDNIDINAATERGVMVASAPGVNAVAVAELTIGLMLGLLRRIPAVHQEVVKGGFPRALGRELSSSTVGIVGLGRIGREVARRVLTFGATVQGYDPYVDPPSIDAPIEGVDFDTLTATADIVTLHVPLTSETKRFYSREAFERMKPGALFVNTARGALVDTSALQRALSSGHLGGAAIDVFDMEPPPADSRFVGENVILTPHIGGLTHEAMARTTRSVVATLLAAYRGGKPETLLNSDGGPRNQVL